MSVLPALSAERDLLFTASMAPIAVNGDDAQRNQLFLEKIGVAPPPDFTRDLPVILGRLTEQPMLDYLEMVGGHEITRRQHWVRHPTRIGIGATLDGYRAHDDSIIEYKYQNPYKTHREITTWYGPQVLVQMRCAGTARGSLVVLQGVTLTEHEIEITPEYEAKVWEQIEAFQRCLDSLTPPAPVTHKVIAPPEKWRTIDFALDAPLPNWAPEMMGLLRDWADTKQAHGEHEDAKKIIKELLPGDVGTVIFADLSVKRDKRGSVTIRQTGI